MSELLSRFVAGDPSVNRRRFLQVCASTAAVTLVPLGMGNTGPTYRAAVIGHTRQGNYGHEMDLVFNDRENLQVVAVADPDSAGRAKAAARSKALRQYADYREMLAVEKPNLVAVAPRWTDQHFAMVSAALKAGAHVYVEKPFARTLAEAHALVAQADQAHLKIAVAHQMRLAPNILALQRALDGGLIGDLLEIRAHGKQDHRAGGEDLIVLGVHLFDLMRFFAGDPLWCTARVLEKGHEIRRTATGSFVPGKQASENIGPIAGDEIFAHYAFPGGVNATFVSSSRDRSTAGLWGLELRGSKGAIRIQMEMIPRILHQDSTDAKSYPETVNWRPWQPEPPLSLPPVENTFPRANARVVDDWLQAISADREPVCSGRAATWALEMAHAVFAAGLAGTRVTFPLADRRHPLE